MGLINRAGDIHYPGSKRTLFAIMDGKLTGSQAMTDPVTPIFEPTIDSQAKPEDLKQAKAEFWAKMKRFAGKVPFAKDAVALYYFITDPAVGLVFKGAAVAALLYFISPADVIPDAIPLAGFMDDAGVIAAVMSLLGSQLKPYKDRASEWLKRGQTPED